MKSVPATQISEKAEPLSAALTLLTQMVSQGQYTSEHHAILTHLGQRIDSLVSSIFHLTKQHWNDEATSLLRTLGELTNLLHLFSIEAAHFLVWQQMEDQERWENYGPAQVRALLERLRQQPSVPRHLYSFWCQSGVHILPASVRITEPSWNSQIIQGHTLRLLARCLVYFGNLARTPNDRKYLIHEIAETLLTQAHILGCQE